ncbi:hypothetical protein [Acanthopleuribacter pedis]|uniref:Uncharacterized protein n=1 Tax=Acanthopleuribacter pedis TaxID=442870 RepID=A0A8J7U3E0_9BACT|nr:hypothetical protein [Acanthopleuribacter pedis]MBO1320298.1 hypothetical protein [Acanthopleuribacter pedis]
MGNEEEIQKKPLSPEEEKRLSEGLKKDHVVHLVLSGHENKVVIYKNSRKLTIELD